MLSHKKAESRWLALAAHGYSLLSPLDFFSNSYSKFMNFPQSIRSDLRPLRPSTNSIPQQLPHSGRLCLALPGFPGDTHRLSYLLLRGLAPDAIRPAALQQPTDGFGGWSSSWAQYKLTQGERASSIHPLHRLERQCLSQDRTLLQPQSTDHTNTFSKWSSLTWLKGCRTFPQRQRKKIV